MLRHWSLLDSRSAPEVALGYRLCRALSDGRRRLARETFAATVPADVLAVVLGTLGEVRCVNLAR